MMKIKDNEERTCDGRCCKLFILCNGRSPEELKEKMHRQEVMSPQWLKYRQMIIVFKYLGYKKHKLPKGIIIPDKSKLVSKNNISRNKFHAYTCRNQNKNGLCNIYEIRPELCRRYGTEEQLCEYKNCKNRNKFLDKNK